LLELNKHSFFQYIISRKDKKLMKKLLTFSLCFALLMSMSSVAFAASGEVVKTTAAITIDGKADEAAWATAKTYKMPNYIVAVPGKPVEVIDPKKDASDFSGEWKALWDDKNFYLYIKVVDPTRIGFNQTTKGREGHWDDTALFLIADSASKESTYTTGMWHPVAEQDKLLAFYGGPLKGDLSEWAKVESDKQVSTKLIDNGNSYTIEAAIPWEIAGHPGIKPSVGKKIGFDVHATDNDYGEKDVIPEVPGRYAQSKITWHNLAWEGSQHLGELTLAAAPAASKPAANSGSETKSDSAAAPTSLPKTGMGGASDSSSAAWMLVAVSLLAIAAISVYRMRKN
jgi:hypothetical protein